MPVTSSSHAPWHLEEKSDPEALKNSSGVPVVQTLDIVPLGQSLKDASNPAGESHSVVRAIVGVPADRFGLGDRKRRITVGYAADLVLRNPGSDYAIIDGGQKSYAGWTLFSGLRPDGRVGKTIFRGKEIYSAHNGRVRTETGELQTRR